MKVKPFLCSGDCSRLLGGIAWQFGPEMPEIKGAALRGGSSGLSTTTLLTSSPSLSLSQLPAALHPDSERIAARASVAVGNDHEIRVLKSHETQVICMLLEAFLQI